MIRPLRAAALLAVCGALGFAGGCGFQPLYGTQAYAGLPGMTILAGDTRQEYLIEQSLDRFLGAGRSPYTLTLDVAATESRLGVSAAGRASRFAYTVRARYALSATDAADLAGSVSETVYFDAPGDPYALIAARADAEERAAEQVAQSLARDIAAGLERRARARS